MTIHRHRYHQLFFSCFVFITLVAIGARFWGVPIANGVVSYIVQLVFVVYSSYLYFVLHKSSSSAQRRLELYRTTPGAFIILYKNGKIEVSTSALKLLSSPVPMTSVDDLGRYFSKNDIAILNQLSKDSYSLSRQCHGEIHIKASNKPEQFIRYTAIRSKLKYIPGCKVVVWLFECTEAKQQELSLIKYLNKYRIFSFELELLVNSLPMAVWRREEDLSVVMRSGGYKELLLKAGYPEGVESFTDAEDYMLKKLRAKRYSELTYKKNLTISGITTLLKFVEVPTPNVGGTVGYALEIPELFKLEDRAATLQTTLDTMLDTFPQGVLVVNSSGNVEMANRSFINIFSIEESILAQRISFSSLIDKMQEYGTLPETKNYKSLKEEYLSLLDPNSSRSIFYMHLPNNVTLRVLITGEPGLNTIFVYENVTELLKIERAYKDLLLSFRAAAETSSNPMAIFGQDSKLKFYNAAFSSVFKEDVTQLLASNPRFDSLIELFSAQGNLADIVPELDDAMSSRQEKHYSYHSLDGHIVDVLFKPLPNNTVLVKFHELLPATTGA